MAQRTKKVDDSVDVVADATYQMLEGKVEGQTYVDTVLSAFDASTKSTRVSSYVRGLKRFRRRLLDNVIKQVNKANRISKNIHMIEKLAKAKKEDK